MKILALDTCLSKCSIAITEDDTLLAEIVDIDSSRQAEELIPNIDSLLDELSVKYHDIDIIAVTVGPGSFTGARIGLAAAKGLVIATSKPLLGVTSLQALAFHAQKNQVVSQDKITSIIDAKRNQFYVQIFNNNKNISPLSEPMLIDKDDLRDVLDQKSKTVCNFSNDVFDIETSYIQYTACDVAHLASLTFSPNSIDIVEPIYIRPPDAKLPTKKHV